MVRRARAGGRLREGVRPRSTSGSRRLGAVLALRRPRPVRRAARAPVQATSTRERVLVLRYRTVVDDPRAAVDRACRFLGITPGPDRPIPRDNSRELRRAGLAAPVLGPVVRTGAWLGQFAPPEVWRKASVPLVAQLGGSGDAHPPAPHAGGRASGCCPASPTTSACSASSPARTSATGCRPTAAARSAAQHGASVSQ